jgi:osmotically-inducible protein OsmY
MIASANPALSDLAPPQLARHLADSVETALAASKYVSLRKLQCRADQGVVEISGTVPSFYLKQLAQAAVQQLHPGATVRNLVEVRVS